jgi:hypothetical protein
MPFTAVPRIGPAPLTVQFINRSTNTPTSWYVWRRRDEYHKTGSYFCGIPHWNRGGRGGSV